MFLLYLFVFVLGVLIGYLLGHHSLEDKYLSVSHGQMRGQRLEILREHLKGKKEVTNAEVEDLLSVSDATAERYLQELEVKGIVEQVGKSGPYVKYKVKE